MDTSYQKIVCATDLSPEDETMLRRALDLARKHNGRIVVLHALQPQADINLAMEDYGQMEDIDKMVDESRFWGGRREKAQELLNHMIENICGEGQCQTEFGENIIEDVRLTDGDPERSILEQAEALGADLIVMGTHTHSRFAERLFGTTPQKVAHDSDIPVLLVRTTERRRAA